MTFFLLWIIGWPPLIGCWVICSLGLSQRTPHLSRSSPLCWCHCLFTCVFFVCVFVFVFDSEEAITVLVFPTNENTKKSFFFMFLVVFEPNKASFYFIFLFVFNQTWNSSQKRSWLVWNIFGFGRVKLSRINPKNRSLCVICLIQVWDVIAFHTITS